MFPFMERFSTTYLCLIPGGASAPIRTSWRPFNEVLRNLERMEKHEQHQGNEKGNGGAIDCMIRIPGLGDDKGDSRTEIIPGMGLKGDENDADHPC